MFVVGVLILGITHAGFNSNIKSKFGMQNKIVINIIDVSDSELQNQFSYFVSRYEKSYANDEQNLRFQIFNNNYRRIEEHNLNSKALGYTLRMNQFGDLTLKEFTEKITGKALMNTPNLILQNLYLNMELSLQLILQLEN